VGGLARCDLASRMPSSVQALGMGNAGGEVSTNWIVAQGQVTLLAEQEKTERTEAKAYQYKKRVWER
jgi:hypothetical protein